MKRNVAHVGIFTARWVGLAITESDHTPCGKDIYINLKAGNYPSGTYGRNEGGKLKTPKPLGTSHHFSLLIGFFFLSCNNRHKFGSKRRHKHNRESNTEMSNGRERTSYNVRKQEATNAWQNHARASKERRISNNDRGSGEICSSRSAINAMEAIMIIAVTIVPSFELIRTPFNATMHYM